MQVKETEYEDTVFIAQSVNMETSVAKKNELQSENIHLPVSWLNKYCQN